MNTPRRAWLVTTIVAAATVASLVAGCGENLAVNPTAPDAAPLSQVVKGSLPATANSPSQPIELVTYDPSYVPMAQSHQAGIIKAAKGGRLSAGGFVLTIPRGALSSDTFMSIDAVNGTVMQCRVEPTGIAFRTPVVLTFKYTGTSADPSCPSYDPTGALTACWLDPSYSTWTDIGGSDDAGHKEYSVSLSHLSYYALAK